MVLLEIQFLREAGKLDIRPERFLKDMKQAAFNEAPLLTRDKNILEHYHRAVWD